jgi:hypothetical protein
MFSEPRPQTPESPFPGCQAAPKPPPWFVSGQRAQGRCKGASAFRSNVVRVQVQYLRFEKLARCFARFLRPPSMLTNLSSRIELTHSAGEPGLRDLLLQVFQYFLERDGQPVWQRTIS